MYQILYGLFELLLISLLIRFANQPSLILVGRLSIACSICQRLVQQPASQRPHEPDTSISSAQETEKIE